jgi:hypothetical protein
MSSLQHKRGGGFNAEKSLLCEMCGLPARSSLKHICRCQKLDFQTEKEFSFEKQLEDL